MKTKRAKARRIVLGRGYSIGPEETEKLRRVFNLELASEFAEYRRAPKYTLVLEVRRAK